MNSIMREKIRVAGIIIQDGKLLLVKGAEKYKEYWLPGGTLERDESELDCLKRELLEEVSLRLVSAHYFGEYIVKSEYHEKVMIRNKIYLVTVSGTVNPRNEIIGFVWLSREEFNNNVYSLIANNKEKIIPDLITQGYF